MPQSKESLETLLQVVLSLTDSLVFEFDAGGHFLAAWTRSDSQLVLPREAFMGRHISEVMDPQTAARTLESIQRVLARGEPERFEYSVEVEGGRRWYSADATLVPDRPGVAFLTRDITRQKTLELSLLQADRLAALGTLAAGVAHEVNNPLGYLSSNLHFIEEGLAEVRRALAGTPGLAPLVARLEECEEALDEARQGTTRIRNVVGDLKTFARGEDTGPEKEQADVRRALEMSINMAMPELRHRARMVWHVEEVPPVRGSESRLGQVLLNLLLNAAQAIPEGAPAENTVEALVRAEGGKVAIEIRDTGHGISPENLKRIFEPFFTTRPAGVGTGLGLAICHSIVIAMGGELTVESTVGQGTCFRVLLPTT
ncbi:PAS domain S-box-containing protein [Archangium gephyra]|uniref:histidine kinase n=1 Tax=Archangium gephyra TaxID=48 RepID=A0AAC8QGV1_9BACT|nr:ATP-binding protein [Archangium gephyra]AKJ07181.1 Sensory box histidine kinase/response regulator [Archangium gephyra]REG26593.1 PAS domain S-box-containing protein [Archangium gephyra]